SH
ncbi:ataxin-2 C-terminal domain protein, partial [Chlamydia suis MD56]